MFITGIVGNVSVCMVILRIPGMRSATNYYLFSLAIADLLILLMGRLVNFVSGSKRKKLITFLWNVSKYIL